VSEIAAKDFSWDA
jgi:hypothetical protein